MLVDLDPKDASFNEFLAATVKAQVALAVEALDGMSAPAVQMRYGQVFFNLLDCVRPRLADELRGTIADPFYRDEVGTGTLEWLEQEWDN